MVGKPADGKPRDVRVVLLAMPEERDAWNAAAKKDGRTLSSWLRKLANDAAPAKKGKR